MIQPKEIHAAAGQTGVRDTQVEKNYVISWVLYGIAQTGFLKQNLVFRGGTMLKKVYFPGYRFSEHLDFTLKGDLDIPVLKASFPEAFKAVYEASGIPLSMKGEKQNGTGNFSFYISYIGPLGAPGGDKDIKVDISANELMYTQPEEKTILNEYSDLKNEEYGMLCCTIEEIAAEKMRSLMQRTAPRDIYDLWYLFEMYGHSVEDSIFAFQEKTRFKKLDPGNFVPTLVKKEEKFAKQWKEQLSPQLKTLPEFKKVWRELEKSWRRFEKFTGE